MRACAPLLLALASCAATSQGGPPPEGPRAKLAVLYGQRWISNSYIDVEKQDLLGVQASYALPMPRWAVEVGYFSGEADDSVAGIDVESATEEFSVGMLHTFVEGWLRPYAGFGLAWIEAELDGVVGGDPALVPVDDDDSSIGFYASAGVDAWVTRHLALGLQYRFLIATEVTLGGTDFDADYGQLAVTASLAF
jgi:opacity protein-like surface antigen